MDLADRLLQAFGWLSLGIFVLFALVVIALGIFSVVFSMDAVTRLYLVAITFALGTGGATVAIFRFLATSPPKFVRCSYCGSKNSSTATYCIFCEKLLPKDRPGSLGTDFPDDQ